MISVIRILTETSHFLKDLRDLSDFIDPYLFQLRFKNFKKKQLIQMARFLTIISLTQYVMRILRRPAFPLALTCYKRFQWKSWFHVLLVQFFLISFSNFRTM